MRHWIVYFIIYFSFNNVLTGQLPYVQAFQQNWVWVNPAAMDRSYILPDARNRNPNNLNAALRQQWIGIEGAPRTYSLSFEHNPIVVRGNKSLNIKWGGQLFSDQVGNFSNLGAYGNFVYSLKFSGTRNSRLFLGINAGLVNTGYGALASNEIKDPNDLLLESVQGENVTFADLGFGLFFQQNRSFYAGLSAPRLINPVNVSLNDGSDLRFLIPRSSFQRPLYFIAGGFIGSGPYQRKSLILEPNIWIRYNPGQNFYTAFSGGSPLSLDFNLRSYFQQKFWLGVGYATHRQLALDFGIDLPVKFSTNYYDRIRIGIGSMLPFLSNNLNLGTSLELNLSYSWN